MFTGIVEQVGNVHAVVDTPKGKRLSIRGEGLGALPMGASIAVNGVCLTAVAGGEDEVTVEIVPETISRTNLGSLRPGSEVNLERAMPADGRFDGHIVQGHVDGTGEISAIEESAGAVEMTVSIDESIRRYLVEKGSVTVDGVSLTVAAVDSGTFSVALIPHTLDVTTLGLRKPGDRVNLEADVLAKYVERLLGRPE